MKRASEELVDIVDELGRTIYVATRADMRRGRLPHRCVYLLVFDEQRRLFIHLRTPTKDVFPSHWDAAIGGVLAAGESYSEGIKREAREELGIDVPTEELFPFQYSNQATIVHGMVYRAFSSGPFMLQPEEIIRGEFVTVEEVFSRAEKEPFCPDALEVLRQYCNSASPKPVQASVEPYSRRA